jgi:hypothetical protein
MKKHRDQKNCLNCGNTFTGNFCNNCGQENLHLKENFGHVMTHAIADYFHFDQKFFHTLKPLLFQPGKLTIDYNEGKRVQYLHPVRMYIFISLIYFILVFQNGNDMVKVNHTNPKKPADRGYVDGNLDKTNDDKPSAANINVDDADQVFGAKILKTDTTYNTYMARQNTLNDALRDNFLQHYIVKKYFAWKKEGHSAKDIFEEGLKHNIPKMMFFLLPVLAWLLKVAFAKNKKYYIEHLIFSFHLHCFFFLFLSIIILMQMVLPAVTHQWLGFAAFIITTWYIYKALRTVYNRSPFRTITKMIGMSLSYLVIFSACFMLLIVITAITSV